MTIMFADQVEHDYNSAVPTFTKTPHPGRMSVNVGYSNLDFTHAYVSKQNTALPNELKFDITGFRVSAMYHGVNGVGFSGSQIMEDFSFNNGDKPSRITSSFGAYIVWNEIYPESTPSALNSHQYTFPTTRILTGLGFSRMKDINNQYYEGIYGYGAFDLIISNSLIFTNRLQFDLQDNKDFLWSMVTSKLIYDLDDIISIAASGTYGQNNSGDYETIVILEGGYQFRNLNYGNLYVDAKISPFLRFNIAGQNVVYANREVGFNLYFFFN